MNQPRGSARMSGLALASTPLDFEGARARFRVRLGLDRPCACCAGQSGDANVRPRPSRTAYAWDGEGENPNADILLCDPCAEDHTKLMDEMWGEYWSGIM